MISTQHRFIHSNSFEPFPIEDDSIDLVVTSPPYPMVEMWDEILGQQDSNISSDLEKGDGHSAFERIHSLLDECWKECFRVLKNGAFACINIGDATRTLDGRFQMYSNHSRILTACSKIGFDIMPSIMWRKPTNTPTKFMGSGMLPGGAYVTLEHEWILIMRKGPKRVFDKEEQVLRRKSAMFWEERNTWFSDQWDGVLGTSQILTKGARVRSAAYPIEIPHRLIAMYSMYGDTVLDPFLGTGTTSLAAMELGRSSKGIDVDERLIKESASIPTRRPTKGFLHNILEARVTSHLEYVSSKDMLFFKYKNKGLNMPVKTRQEQGMYIYPIKSITRSEERIEVKYRKWRGAELEALRPLN